MPPHCLLHSAGIGHTQQDDKSSGNSSKNINRCCHSSNDDQGIGKTTTTTSNGQICVSHTQQDNQQQQRQWSGYLYDTLSTDANQTVYMTFLQQHFCFLCAKTGSPMLSVQLQVNMLMSNKGTVLRCDVNGKIVMKVFLSGMPDVKLGLNDKLEVCHPFVHAFIHPFMHLFIHPSIHSFSQTFARPFIHSFIRV